MAATDNTVSVLEKDIQELNVSSSESNKTKDDTKSEKTYEPHLWGFETRELYKIALNFYKEKEGKAVHLSYEDKLKLIAFTQQVMHGKCTAKNAPPLGVLDVIGKDRRLAWQNLGDISKEQAMEGFIVLLDKLCPLFKTVVEAQKRDIEEKKRLKKEEEVKQIEEEEKRLKKEEEIMQIEEKKRLAELAEAQKQEEKERLRLEAEKRQIQNALNRQTYYQFRDYAEQQYPEYPEQQAVLVRQLQEQHYHNYMQQLHKKQLVIKDQKPQVSDVSDSTNNTDIEKEQIAENESNLLKDEVSNVSDSTNNKDIEKEQIAENESNLLKDEDSDDLQEDWPPIATAEMWTRKGVEEFKEIIRKEAGDAVIKVGHGETVTVRVPTLDDSSCLFWEFATDSYDIGFGVYFEWSKSNTDQVSVHINESEDDENEDDEYEIQDDLESGGINENNRIDHKPTTPPISVIVPIYRRDSQEEVYAGSHQYPGQGVYLLKFDNSYSLWRSKTLYYRVYYTRPGFTKD